MKSLRIGAFPISPPLSSPLDLERSILKNSHLLVSKRNRFDDLGHYWEGAMTSQGPVCYPVITCIYCATFQVDDIKVAKKETPVPHDKTVISDKSCCPKCQLDLATSVTICPRCQTELVQILKPGESFADKYELLGTIGSGGMGVIYKARNKILNKIVAIKTLHPHLTTPEALRRFQREGKAAGNLRHPNIITIYDLGITDQGSAYMVMEFIQGRTLADMLKQGGPLNLNTFFEVFAQVCDALDYAHANGVLHRDIKPSNIMLNASAQGALDVRILDFGIAKFAEADNRESQHLTRTGEAIGSPLYMSPEQSIGSGIDQRSDLYSLGCVMYEALCGLTPHEGATALATMMKHLKDQPLSLKEISLGSVEVPAAVEALVMKLLAKSPEDRFQTMDEVRHELLATQQNHATRGKNRSMPVADKVKKSLPGRSARPRIVSFALVCISVTALVEFGVILLNWSKISPPESLKSGSKTVATDEPDKTVKPIDSNTFETVLEARGKEEKLDRNAINKIDDPIARAFKEKCSEAVSCADKHAKEQLCEQALQQWNGIVNPPSSILDNASWLATFYVGKRNDISISICRRIISVCEKFSDIEHDDMRARALCGLGHLYKDLNNYAAARQALNEAMAIYKKHQDERGMALCSVGFGMIARNDEHDRAKAERILKQAVPVLEENVADEVCRWALIMSLGMIAECQEKQNRPQEAQMTKKKLAQYAHSR